MIMKQTSFLFACLFSLANSWAQPLKPINVGETCPDVIFNKIVNADVQQARLSDFKGRWVVLYFWGVGCSSCIKKMPSIDRLQKKYADKAAIFTITHNSEAEIANLWAKSPAIKARNTPLPGTIVEDSVMHELFPNRFVPYVIWIDPHRKVREITYGDYLTEGALNCLLSGGYPDWLPIATMLTEYSHEKLFLEPKHTDDRLPLKTFYSAVTSYRHGIAVAGGLKRDSVNQCVKFCWANESIPDLYNISLMETSLFRRPNRMILKSVTDSSAYFYLDTQQPRTEWERLNQYCYEAVLPITVSDSIFYSSMRSDLDRFFNIHSEIRKIDTTCVLITRIGTGAAHECIEALASKDNYFGYALGQFISIINQEYRSQITVLEKGIDKEQRVYFPKAIRFEILNGLVDIQIVNKLIEQNGFNVKPRRKQLEFLILTENK